MRNKLAFIPVALFSFLALFSSCEKNCGSCGPLQTCQSGTCQCSQGLEGANCDIHSSDKFQGAYTVYELYNPAYQGQSSLTFTCNIQPSGTEIDKIWFDNFNGTGLQVYGIINTVYLTIPDQVVGAAEITGQGTFNTATRLLSLKYTISAGGNATLATSNFQHQ